MTVQVRARREPPAAPLGRTIPPTVAVAGLIVLLSPDLGPHRFPEWGPVRTIVLLSLALAGVALSLGRPVRWAARSPAERLLVVAFGWVALAAPLATDPIDASLTAAALLGTIVIGGSITRRWPFEQTLIGASFGFSLALGVSAALGASTSSDSRWAGLTEEPNALAVIAAFALVVGLATIDHHWIGCVSTGLGALTLVMTHAALPAAAAGVGALFVLLPVAPAPHRRPLVASVVSSIAAVATSIAVISADRLPGDGERLKSLNERTGIWSYLAEAIAERPLLGHGPTSTRDLIALGAFDERVHWTPTHAHNALVEIGVAGGLPAAVLLLGAVIASFVGARRARSFEVMALTATFAGLAVTEHLVREPNVAVLMLALAAPMATASFDSGPVSDVPSADDNRPNRDHHVAPSVEEMPS